MAMKIVKIDWIDSMSSEGWQYPSFKPTKSMLVTSVGILVDECKETITLASCRHQDGGPRSPVTIPKLAITKIKRMNM